MASLVQYHDTTYSPVGLWNFNNVLTDSSGNGYDLSVASGNAHYGDIIPGVRGLICDGSSQIYRSTFTSALAILGDLTIEMLLAYGGGGFPVSVVLVSHSATGETSDTNSLYRIGFGDAPVALNFFSESGAGVDASYSISEVVPQTLCHLAVTRTSDIIQFYLNGKTLGAASSALTTPTDGSNGRFYACSDAGGAGPAMTLASLKVVASALSASQVKAEYTRTLGGFFGF